MGTYFDLVINCDLREDISAEFIEAIQCLMSKDNELEIIPKLFVPDYDANIWTGFYDKTFLTHDPENDVISNFQRRHRMTIPSENNRKVYRYHLQYCGSMIHDDYWAACHLPFVYWLATVSHDNHLGFYKETGQMGRVVQHLVVENGKLLEY